MLISGIITCFIPLIGDFYLETASFSALIFSLWICISKRADSTLHGDDSNDKLATGKKPLTPEVFSVLRDLSDNILYYFILLLLFLIPIAIKAIITQCFNLQGLLFIITIPFSTIILFSAITICTSILFKRNQIWNVIIWVLLSAIIPLLILFFVPHIYLYNSVWGWFPGPIYDEQVVFSELLLYHRIFVITVSALTVTTTILYIGHRKNYMRIALFVLCIVSISLAYSLYRGGIIRTISQIQSEMGRSIETEHFNIIFDNNIALTDQEMQYWSFWHEFHAHELRELLNVEAYSIPIQSFMYSDVWQKKHFTGAKFTSYVPTWNSSPQLHLDRQTGHYILRHELVHVYSRMFGMPLIKANINMGLTEGLAVAFEDPRSLNNTRDELIVNSGVEINADLVSNVMGYLGFYSGRSFVNYSVSGSFINYLATELDIEHLKCAYSSFRIGQCIDNIDEMKCAWADRLNSIPVDSTLRPLARSLFARESIFEKKCARFVSHAESEMDQIQKLLYRDQRTEAYDRLNVLHGQYPGSLSIWLQKTMVGMYIGEPMDLTHQLMLTTPGDSIQYYLRLSDILIYSNEYDEATQYINTLINIDLSNSEQHRLIRILDTRGIRLNESPIDDAESTGLSVLSVDHRKWAEYLKTIIGSNRISDLDYKENMNMFIAVMANTGRFIRYDDIETNVMDHVDVLDQQSLRIVLDQVIPQITSESDLWIIDRLLNKYKLSSVGTNIPNQIELYRRAVEYALKK